MRGAWNKGNREVMVKMMKDDDDDENIDDGDNDYHISRPHQAR